VSRFHIAKSFREGYVGQRWRLVENRDKSNSWRDKFLSRKHKKRINVARICIQVIKLLIMFVNKLNEEKGKLFDNLSS